MIVVLCSSIGQAFGEDKPAYEVADIYTEMRGQVLAITENALPDLKGKPVYAVLMETGFPEAAYTLVAAADGTASLYFSNGGGLIGAGEHANVRPESHKLVAMAEQHLKHMHKVDKFPLVRPEETTFYVVTPNGVFSYSAKEADLGEDRDKRMSPLFHQAHQLIGQMRFAQEQDQTDRTK